MPAVSELARFITSYRPWTLLEITCPWAATWAFAQSRSTRTSTRSLSVVTKISPLYVAYAVVAGGYAFNLYRQDPDGLRSGVIDAAVLFGALLTPLSAWITFTPNQSTPVR